jgi:hypothetical protein
VITTVEVGVQVGKEVEVIEEVDLQVLEEKEVKTPRKVKVEVESLLGEVVVHTTDEEVLLVKIEVWTIQVKVQIIEGETPEREEDRREV